MRKQSTSCNPRVEKARSAVIAAARVAIFGDEEESDPILNELRKALRRLDKVEAASRD